MFEYLRENEASRRTVIARNLSRTVSRFVQRRGVTGRLEALLWAIAVLALGAAGFGYADAALFQRRHADTDFAALDSALEARTTEGAEARPASFPPGTAIARLAIPRLEVEAVVAEGVDSAVLRRAIGRLPATSLPGSDGNIALAAHRDTFFRALEGVELGDILVLESASGVDTYRVEWTAVVEPDYVDVVAETAYPALTLITCYPFRYVGDAPQRFVVRARRTDSPTHPLRAAAVQAARAARG